MGLYFNIYQLFKSSEQKQKEYGKREQRSGTGYVRLGSALGLHPADDPGGRLRQAGRQAYTGQIRFQRSRQNRKKRSAILAKTHQGKGQGKLDKSRFRQLAGRR